MCTLTVIPLLDHGRPVGFRLATNRDESPARALARRPERRRVGPVTALWPVDPVGGGTWIAATDRGVVLSVLNYNLTPPPALPAAGLVSRGQIIPAVAEVSRAADAIKRLGSIDLACFAPFRLVVADRAALLVAAWDRATLRVERRELGPACFASSGLGDHLVAPRLALFDEWLASRALTSAVQDEFHRHEWPGRPEISVRMRRDGARTVSTTVVEVRRDHGDPAARPAVTMIHEDDASRTVASLDRAEPRIAVSVGERVRC